EVTGIDLLHRKLREYVAADRDEAVGRIEAVPITGSGLRQETEAKIAEAPQRRHCADCRQVTKPISLRVVGFTCQERLHQGWHERHRHLAVAVNLHDDVGLEIERLSQAGHHRRADSAVALMSDQMNAWIELRRSR